jgi:hypothetical protein
MSGMADLSPDQNMDTVLLSMLPILCVLASFFYAVLAGARAYRSTGRVSILAVATTLAGLTAGQLLKRFLPATTALDDSVNYLSLRVEVALLLMLAATLTFLAVTLLRRDAPGQPKPFLDSRRGALLAALFFFAAALVARSKIAAYLAVLLVKAHHP